MSRVQCKKKKNLTLNFKVKVNCATFLFTLWKPAANESSVDRENHEVRLSRGSKTTAINLTRHLTLPRAREIFDSRQCRVLGALDHRRSNWKFRGEKKKRKGGGQSVRRDEKVTPVVAMAPSSSLDSTRAASILVDELSVETYDPRFRAARSKVFPNEKKSCPSCRVMTARAWGNYAPNFRAFRRLRARFLQSSLLFYHSEARNVQTLNLAFDSITSSPASERMKDFLGVSTLSLRYSPFWNKIFSDFSSTISWRGPRMLFLFRTHTFMTFQI